MKIGNKARLIVTIVIFVAAIATLFTIYSRQAGERADLNERLNRAQILLPGLAANKESLEDKLAQAQSSLNTNLGKFPESVKSIEYDDDLFEIADDCNVDISRLTALQPANRKVGAVTYSVSSFTVTVNGGIDNILEFIYAIRTGDDFQMPWSAEVNRVYINIAKSTATISLDIYGYKG
jgi:hypothetical protein